MSACTSGADHTYGQERQAGGKHVFMTASYAFMVCSHYMVHFSSALAVCGYRLELWVR